MWPTVSFARVAGVIGSIAVAAIIAVPPALSGTPAHEALDDRVRGAMEASAVPGLAYAIVEDGAIVHLAAFGTAGPDGRPMTPQTPIVIGSVGKSITALAVRQLIEAGQLDLDSPVTAYLPWFALDNAGAGSAPITIGSLVDHTSGLSTAAGQDPAWYTPGLSPEDVVRRLASIRPARVPGAYEYSNLNYVILGVVVEAIAGTTYDSYVASHIFEPLGMARSFTDLEAATVAGPAQGHRYLFGQATPFDEPYPTGMVAAGYQVSTAEDMARFAAALSNGGIHQGIDVVPGDSRSSETHGYGTDWSPLTSLQAGSILSQSGSTLSSNADILVLPSNRVGVVVLLNANPTQFLGIPAGAADIARDILHQWTGAGTASAAPTVRSVYLVVDVVLIALTATLLIHAWRARSWQHRLATSRHRRRFLARAAIADGFLPITVLVGLPLLIGTTGSSPSGDVRAGWAFVLWTLPDVGFAVLALSLGGLALGAFKLRAARIRPRAISTASPLETASRLS